MSDDINGISDDIIRLLETHPLFMDLASNVVEQIARLSRPITRVIIRPYFSKEMMAMPFMASAWGASATVPVIPMVKRSSSTLRAPEIFLVKSRFRSAGRALRMPCS